jgi:hypothetical protein
MFWCTSPMGRRPSTACGEHSDRLRLGRSAASGPLTRVIAGSHLKPADRSGDNLTGTSRHPSDANESTQLSKKPTRSTDQP